MLGAKLIATPHQSLISALSQHHSISKGLRSLHHDQIPCHGLQTLQKHVLSQLIPECLLAQFKLQLLELCDILLH